MKCVAVLFLVAFARAMPAIEKEANDPNLGGVLSVVRDCVDGDMSLCLKVNIVK